MWLARCKLKTQECGPLWAKSSRLVHLAYNSLVKTTIPVPLPEGHTSHSDDALLASSSSQGFQKLIYERFPEEGRRHDRSVCCCLALETWIGSKWNGSFLRFLFCKCRACCSSVQPRCCAEPRAAFKFKRTAAFCSLRSSETWPKTGKGCLAGACCQRFNIWILLWE